MGMVGNSGIWRKWEREYIRFCRGNGREWKWEWLHGNVREWDQ